MMRVLLYMVCFMVLASCSNKKETNWNLILDKNSKEPYGCYIARQCLTDLFAHKDVRNISNALKQIQKSNQENSTNECMFITCSSFQLDSVSWQQLKDYVVNGNHVVICAYSFSDFMLNELSLENPVSYTKQTMLNDLDSIPNQLIGIQFNDELYEYTFHGKNINTPFGADSSNGQNIKRWGGCGDSMKTNLITFTMQGSLTLCSNPIIMTNYFLLQEPNKSYLECLVSSLPSYPNEIYWYSQLFHNGELDAESEWSKMLKIPGLRYSFLILIGLLACYLIFESKRRQRYVPILPPHTNTSLEFTETVGSLYFSKKNNANIISKMITHYLEHIRSNYNLRTNMLDEAFSKQLSIKLNKPFEDVKAFIAYLDYIRTSSDVTDQDVVYLYHQIKKYS